MKLINKIIVSTLAVSTIGAGVMFMNYNSSNILTDYNNIQNGVSKRADLKEGSDDPLVTSNQFDPSKGYTQSSPVPDSLDPNEVMAWVNAQNISPQRKALLNKGLAVFKKARYNCVTPAHMNQNVPDITGLEIECSGFVGYCMKQGAGVGQTFYLEIVDSILKLMRMEHLVISAITLEKIRKESKYFYMQEEDRKTEHQPHFFLLMIVFIKMRC